MSVGSNVEVKSLNQFSATNDLVVTGSLITSGSIRIGEEITDTNSHLVLSSSAGSIVSVSGALNVLGVVPATSNGLVLSSLSRIASAANTGKILIGHAGVDGRVAVMNNAETSTLLLNSVQGTISHISQVLILSGGMSGTSGENVVISGSLAFTGGSIGAALSVRRTAGTVSGNYMTVGAVGTSYFTVQEAAPRITIAGSDVALSTAGVTIYNSAATLLLSSSVGSIVRISSSLGLHSRTTATLPAGTDELSGSILWMSDTKRAVIYGANGWRFIATGSAP